MWLPGTFLNQSSDTKIKVKIGQNLKIKSTVKGLITWRVRLILTLHQMFNNLESQVDIDPPSDV